MSIKVKGFLQDVGGASRVTKLREENFAKGSPVPDPRDPIRDLADKLHPKHMVFRCTDIPVGFVSVITAFSGITFISISDCHELFRSVAFILLSVVSAFFRIAAGNGQKNGHRENYQNFEELSHDELPSKNYKNLQFLTN